jgi:hypothetical protein
MILMQSSTRIKSGPILWVHLFTCELLLFLEFSLFASQLRLRSSRKRWNHRRKRVAGFDTVPTETQESILLFSADVTLKGLMQSIRIVPVPVTAECSTTCMDHTCRLSLHPFDHYMELAYIFYMLVPNSNHIIPYVDVFLSST